MIRNSTLIVLIFLVALSWSCTKESGVTVGKPSTFLRYFNGGNPDEAQTMLETSDKGFMILANTLFSSTGTYRIKLIKTDAYGNQISVNFFPEDFSSSTPKSCRAYAISAIKDNSGNDSGYVITGETIQGGKSSLLVISVGPDGASASAVAKDDYNLMSEVRGMAIVRSKTTGGYFVLGQILNPKTSDDMFLTKLNKNTLDTIWTRTYGAGAATLAKRMFLDNNDTTVYWGGTANRNSATDWMRFVRSGFNAQNTLFDIPVGSFSYNSTGNDFCQYGFQFAFVGGRTETTTPNQYDSVFFRIMSEGGEEGMYKSYPILLKTKDQTLNQKTPPASSICSTNDAGLLLLTTMAVDAAETDTDYYLIKIDLNGTLKWSKQHGSKFLDKGAFVMQASDGGYMVLGTTTLANVPSIFLMKTDLDGNVQ